FDDGQDGHLYPLGKIRRTRRRRAPRQSGTPRYLQCRAGSISERPCGCDTSDGMMTVQAGKNVATIDGIVLDVPIFDRKAFRLNDEQAGIIASARQLGQIVFAGRAAAYARTIRPTRSPPPRSAVMAARPPRHRTWWSARRCGPPSWPTTATWTP